MKKNYFDTNTEFERFGNILNPNKLDFEHAFICKDYAVDTLINGNISECIKYLRQLAGTGFSGMKEVNEQLVKIKENVPEKYAYINDNVFSFNYGK